jgi:hypothetical protein
LYTLDRSGEATIRAAPVVRSTRRPSDRTDLVACGRIIDGEPRDSPMGLDAPVPAFFEANILLGRVPGRPPGTLEEISAQSAALDCSAVVRALVTHSFARWHNPATISWPGKSILTIASSGAGCFSRPRPARYHRNRSRVRMSWLPAPVPPSSAALLITSRSRPRRVIADWEGWPSATFPYGWTSIIDTGASLVPGALSGGPVAPIRVFRSSSSGGSPENFIGRNNCATN